MPPLPEFLGVRRKKEYSRPLWQSSLRLIAVLGGVAALAWIDFSLIQVNSATAAFTFLVLVLGLATRTNLKESVTASVASMLAYNFFFLPPTGTLTIADPENWVALFAFLATAITASHLASSARRKTEEARMRQQELQRMYDFSRALILGHDDRSLPNEITHQIAAQFGIESVWFYSCETDLIYRTETIQTSFKDSDFRATANTGTVWSDTNHGASIVPIRLGGSFLGSLGIAGSVSLSDFALEAITQLIAIAMARARAHEAAMFLEASRQNEQLRSTLLDALAHEFKTPLTSVKAAASTILSSCNLGEPAHELITIIDEETDRMTHLVSDAIEIARIGSSPVSVHKEFCFPEQLISSAVADMRNLFEGRELEIRVSPDLPPINVDQKLSQMTLRQLLSNAWKYSPPGSPIRVKAERQGDFVLFEVINMGPGIPTNEQKRIFEKFYRAPAVRSLVAGTGLGLSISREIIEAQGGRIWVDSEPGTATRFSFLLPATDTQNLLSHSPKHTMA
jgi:two-component system, OmpR family, sensor histidine kinase KdpD